MTNKKTKRLLSLIKIEYNNRLHEAITEADVVDSNGSIVIQPGLKVRHKDSQYEYTVASVEKNPRTGKVSIILRLPEEPRFVVPPSEEVLGENDSDHFESFDMPLSPDEEYSDEDEDMFVVDQEEFEKEYEVK